MKETAKKPELRRRNRRLAKEFAKFVFTSGGGDHAKRIVLTDENAQADYGGWCESAMADQVEALLNKATQ